MAKQICTSFEEKKGIDIKLIDVSKVSPVTDYFIIVTGNSDAQISALVKIVQDIAETENICYSKEGTTGWILIDCGNIVVHIFDEKNRIFYMLERLWADGQEIHFSES